VVDGTSTFDEGIVVGVVTPLTHGGVVALLTPLQVEETYSVIFGSQPAGFGDDGAPSE
jgi:hypothetical protein